MILDPDTFVPVPADREVIGHVLDVVENWRYAPRFNVVETDDGWAVQVTVRTAGAVQSVSQTWMLPEEAQRALSEAYERAEEILVFESGLGLQVEL